MITQIATAPSVRHQSAGAKAWHPLSFESMLTIDGETLSTLLDFAVFHDDVRLPSIPTDGHLRIHTAAIFGTDVVAFQTSGGLLGLTYRVYALVRTSSTNEYEGAGKLYVGPF